MQNGEEFLLDPERAFTQRIDAALQRLDSLKRLAGESADPRRLLDEALAELGTALEELRALEEEVWAQAEELKAHTVQLRQVTGELTLAEERERQRLAMVLHDEFQQLLVGLRFAAGPLDGSEDPKVREIGQEIQDLAMRCLQTSRTLTEELSPPVLHPGGLVPALRWLVRWMAETHHFTVHLESDGLPEGEGPRSPEATVVLFRAIRELLLNAVKHARVDTARVKVASSDGQVQVVVTDTGVGFDPTQLRMAGGTVGGIGLFTIRERLEYLGGGLAIESTPDHGSRFSLWLPISS